MDTKKVMLLIAAVLLCAAIAFGCAQETAPPTSEAASVFTVSAATEARYAELEIREYQGAILDPAIGPRDNSITSTQYVDVADYTLKITGLVDAPMSLSYDEVLAFPTFERLITLYCVEGWDVTILWEGVLITDLLREADVNGSANTVIFKAVDGYTTSLPISTIVERNMIMAYKSNGIDLPPEMGYPFIVVAEDKLGYKWARWVTEIELSDNDEYLGYWEQLGYDNDAQLR